jgi:hypothetical protein
VTGGNAGDHRRMAPRPVIGVNAAAGAVEGNDDGLRAARLFLRAVTLDEGDGELGVEVGQPLLVGEVAILVAIDPGDALHRVPEYEHRDVTALVPAGAVLARARRAVLLLVEPEVVAVAAGDDGRFPGDPARRQRVRRHDVVPAAPRRHVAGRVDDTGDLGDRIAGGRARPRQRGMGELADILEHSDRDASPVIRRIRGNEVEGSEIAPVGVRSARSERGGREWRNSSGLRCLR